MIERKEYLDKLISFRDTDLIKVVMGIRRCGKSTLLQMYIDYLKSTGVKNEQIIFINFEDYGNIEITQAKALNDYVLNKINSEDKFYIILDEVQLVADFERVVNSLRLKRNLDIYITGSNGYFLSGEMATLLSGRYITIEMMPLSYAEYYSAVGKDENHNKYYDDYLRYSSFPYAIELGRNTEKIYDYLAAIVNTIVLKDIVKRKKITEIAGLERLMRFVFDNIGSITSTKKIADFMKSAGYNISIQTIETYISALQETYLIYKVSRLDVNGKEYLKANDKYYVADIGLRYYLLGDKRKDYGAILENTIYLELVRRGYKVFVGRFGNLEIDFIAIKSGVYTYYQAAYTIKEKETWEREKKPLEKINDNYEKYIITLDEGKPSNDKGIKTINLFDFLLKKDY
jgi:predicted AAA+ superfamily ATPase